MFSVHISTKIIFLKKISVKETQKIEPCMLMCQCLELAHISAVRINKNLLQTKQNKATTSDYRARHKYFLKSTFFKHTLL